jgi:hypothetical protein
MTRIRALEVQVAAEANAALTVQSNLKRVEAATAARELAQKRLEAEQSKFDVGMTTNFFVVQAQRDLRDAANTELRTLADYRKSLVNFERAQQAPAGAVALSGDAAAVARSIDSFGVGRDEVHMRKFVVIAIVVAVVGGAAAYFGVFSRGGEAASGPQASGPGGGQQGRGGQPGGGFGGGGFGGPGGGGGMPRVPMTVELGAAKKGDVQAHLTVVGNLIGLQTVDIAPRTGGRLLSVNVQLGDPVRRGQVLAKVEDREIVEQARR